MCYHKSFIANKVSGGVDIIHSVKTDSHSEILQMRGIEENSRNDRYLCKAEFVPPWENNEDFENFSKWDLICDEKRKPDWWNEYESTIKSKIISIIKIHHMKDGGYVVGGSLDLNGTQITAQITALPEGLQVGGYLNLRGTQITALPEGLQVGGYLDLRGTRITALPERLQVGGFLDLSGTQITALPEGLQVGNSLYLSDTRITALPERLQVGGSFYKDF